METGCCPEFEPKKWDGKILDWKNKRFIKGSVFTLFYMPLNFGGVITGLMKKIDSAGGKCPDGLCLSDHTSMFNMDLFVAVDKEIPGAVNAALTGKFLCKVYEGEFKDTKKWCDDFAMFAKGKKLDVGKMLMWYTTCPDCAKKYGKNYVAIVAKIK
jgi:hypothetical protein